MLLNVASLVVASVWIAWFSGRPSTVPSRLLLRISAASSLLALAMIPLSWIPPERLPAPLLVLMPGRYLNFGAMTFVALLIGLLASRRELWSRLVLLFLSCGLLVADRSMLWEFLEHHHHVQLSEPASGRCTSWGWQQPRCSPAPPGRRTESRAELKATH